MIQLLGRATSGNVQKVLFLLEELGLPYERKDYGLAFGYAGGSVVLSLLAVFAGLYLARSVVQ